MSSNANKRSLAVCLENLQNSVQQNRVSAELYKEVSKSLFLISGESQLQAIHETCRNECRSRRNPKGYAAQRETPDSSNALEGTVIDLIEEDFEAESMYDSHPNRLIGTVKQLDELHDIQRRLRGYIIPQDGSRTRLEITRAVYDALCVREDIPTTFNDTIMYMGYRQNEVEIIPPSPKWQNFKARESSKESDGWQCSFMLRYVQPTKQSKSWPWSLRQFAIHSKCDTAANTCMYTLVAPPAEIIEDFKETLNDPNLDDVAATDTCLKIKILHTALAYWRPYVVWIANQLSQISTRITFDDPLRNRLANSAYEGIGERLRSLEGMIDDGIFSLQANQSVVSSLEKMWRYCAIPAKSSREAVCLDVLVGGLQAGFDVQISQLQNLQRKAKRCARTVSSNRDLASSIVLQENGQSLESLAVASKADNEATIELSKRAQEDTEAVKALTLVALVYLPISVVLSFFSTSLYESSDSGFTLKPRWWLFLAIGVPLTVLTLVLWKGYVFLKKKAQGSQQGWYRFGRSRRNPKVDKSTGEKAV